MALDAPIMADQHALFIAVDELRYTLQSFKAIEQLLRGGADRRMEGMRHDDLATLLGTVSVAVDARLADVLAAAQGKPAPTRLQHSAE